MKSPLNISETIRCYGLDRDLKLKQLLVEFDNYIWKDSQINTVDDLKRFEKGYIEKYKKFRFCYNSEIEEFSSVNMRDGMLSLLDRGAFQRTVNNNCELYTKFIDAGLSELETVVVMTFLADISGLYRKDSYLYGVPPFVHTVCEVLNSALAKLPSYSKKVVRACNDYDRFDFKVGDVFTPGFCLTCSADLTWRDYTNNRYVIVPLSSEDTKARNLFCIRDIAEKQVTFLQDASFVVTQISEWGDGKKQFEMEEKE